MRLSELPSKANVMRNLATVSEPSKTEHRCYSLLPNPKLRSRPSLRVKVASPGDVSRHLLWHALAYTRWNRAMQVHAGKNRRRTWRNVDCSKVALFAVTIKLYTELGRQTELGGQSLLPAIPKEGQ